MFIMKGIKLMGYYTTFKINTDCKDADRNMKIFERLNVITDYEFDTNSESEVELPSSKWYNSDKHMKALSLEFVDVLFTVYGDGEDSGDLWVAYYKNGKGTDYMKPVIVYPLPLEEEFK